MTPDIRLGFTAGLTAYLLWGMLPLYFKLLGHISPELMLMHRIVWSVPTGLFLVALAGSFHQIRAAFTPRRLAWLAVSGLLIGGNWLLYIWAVSQDRVLEASLGYYINPLVNVVIGAVFLSERLQPRQWVAVGLATIGVAIMALALGRLPWVALILCFTFAFYSLIRKQVPVDGRAGFVVEAGLLLPVALVWLAQFSASGGALMGQGGWDIPLLILSGPLTAIPLICFAIAAKRLKLSTIGMMQYIGPTLQFIIAVLLGEAFGWTHAVAFGFIWSALIVFSLDGIVASRRRLKFGPAQ